MSNSNKIGRYGEQIVFDLLPDARWVNEKKESGINFDIKWQNLKLDVKTTMQNVPSSKSSVQFYQNNFTDVYVVLVLLAILDDKKYFWIDFSNNPKRILFKKIEDSFSEEELKEKLLSISKERNNYER